MGIFRALSDLILGGDSAGARGSSHSVTDNFPSSGSQESHGMASSGFADVFHDNSSFNPANGLPMIGGDMGFDVAGNLFGTDTSHFDGLSSHSDVFGDGCGIDSGFHDSFGIGSGFDSGFDDSFGTGSCFDDSFGSGCGMHDW